MHVFQYLVKITWRGVSEYITDFVKLLTLALKTFLGGFLMYFCSFPSYTELCDVTRCLLYIAWCSYRVACSIQVKHSFTAFLVAHALPVVNKWYKNYHRGVRNSSNKYGRGCEAADHHSAKILTSFQQSVSTVISL